MPQRHPLLSSTKITLALTMTACQSTGQPVAAEETDPSAARPGWTLVWSDEFDGDAGTQPDPAKWVHDLGGGGWGNAELETYTDRPENAAHDGEGHMVITAREETFTGHDGIERPYTSARLKTQGTFSTQYGRIEARLKLPTGQGIWPAFWMLGDAITEVGWPRCGEIDIMEHIGHEPTRVFSALHAPGHSGPNPLSSHYDLPDGQRFPDGFHVFAVEWGPDAIHWEVDGHRYHTRTPADAQPHDWAFDVPMFIILNVAVGGHWPQYPDETTVFPQTLMIDYVRVYEADGSTADAPTD